MKKAILLLTTLIPGLMITSCSHDKKESEANIRLITLDPGHFHAALIQKSMYSEIDTNVYVFAPAGEELEEHLKRIELYNMHPDNPTHWNEIVYQGAGYFETMLEDRPGNLVILAGNNLKKPGYIKGCVDAGMHVLADKPMAINNHSFELLKESFDAAEKNKVLLYDIMTERSEITTLLQRELSMDTLLFGKLVNGTPENPAVTKESVHHFFKYVSGSPLKRPDWFFDVRQQGEGIADVTTHLIDLIHWECFPDTPIHYLEDIQMITARHWPTALTPEQFREVTGKEAYPSFLQRDVKDSLLNVYANGEIFYKVKGVTAKVSVVWNYQAPEGTGDTHYSIMRGTKANLVIRQGKEQQYKPALYAESLPGTDEAQFISSLERAVNNLQARYPGLELKKVPAGWEVLIPEQYKAGHEAHFAEVTQRFLQYIKAGKLPEWEVPNMLAKYYIIARAVEMANKK